jgi:uncharacterized membrane protein YkoI
MKPRRLLLLFVLPACALIVMLGAASLLLFHAGDSLAGDDAQKARALSQRGDILPLEKIAEHARAAKPGKLIDIELEQKHGRWIYEAEVLDETGRVWELKLDARTGSVLKMELDD